MSYLVWSLPLLVVALCVASGRVTSIGAGLCGAMIATIIALTSAPIAMTMESMAATLGKGLWLAWLVIAVILAGLFFREIVVAAASHVPTKLPATDLQRRRRVFFACFLVGPFAEAATGFGVGQVTTVAMLQSAGIPTLHVVLLGLFSQVLVPWGAMANGTVVGAAFAGMTSHELGVHSAVLSIPLLLAWLVLFWRMTTAAGLVNSIRNSLVELAAVLAGLGLLLLANFAFGPEVAAMTALGPLIIVWFWGNERPNAARWQSTLRIALPFVALILGLAASRGIPSLNHWLRAASEVHPFAGSPSWFPLLHPASWLILVALLTALLTGRAAIIPRALQTTWAHGRNAAATIVVYLVTAQIISDAGMAPALLRQSLAPPPLLRRPRLPVRSGFSPEAATRPTDSLWHRRLALRRQHPSLRTGSRRFRMLQRPP